MQNKILLIITFVLCIIFVVVPKSSSKSTTFFSNKNNITIKDPDTNKINTIDLEEYVIGVVAAEMPASFNSEALKAQAIASRTYAAYKIKTSKKEYDVVTDVTDQSYITVDKMKVKWKEDFDKYYSKISAAVNDTKGKVLYYDGDIIEAYYFSMSNGFTEDSSLVFSQERDYLQSVKSIYDNEELKNFEVSKTLSKNEICQRLEVDCTKLVFSNVERSNTNRVNYITVNGQKLKGTTFRARLNLRSTDFTITELDDNIIITTKGYGHGVGMSQYGANGMAKDGYNYEEILKYYYKNTKISSI